MRYLTLIGLLFLAVPAHATWTVTQHPAGTLCSATTQCLQTVSSTGSGHLIVVLTAGDSGSDTVSSCCNAGCTGSYVQGPHINTSAHDAEIWYCTNSASGATSIGPTWNATTDATTWVREYSSSLGSIGLDGGATPTCSGSNFAANPVTCSLTVSANNDVYAIAVVATNTVSSCTNSYVCTVIAGGFSDGEGYLINQTSWSAPSWTASSGQYSTVAIAFQETASGGGGGVPAPWIIQP